MLLDQVLHIMLNQEYPRFFVSVFFRPQKYIFLHYAILWKMENMRKKIMQTFAKPSSQPSESCSNIDFQCQLI